MRKFIEEIRQSEKPVRQRWFLIFSAIAGLLILIIWVVQFNVAFSGLSEDKGAVASLDEGKSLFQELTAAVSLSFSQIKEKSGGAYGAIKDIVGQTNDLKILNEERLPLIEEK